MCLRFFITCAVFCTGIIFSSHAQEAEIWPQYYVQVPVSKKWSVNSDYSHRYSDFFQTKTQWIGRSGLEFKASRALSLSGGYAYSEFFTGRGVRRESRPWQQALFENSFRKVKLSHRFRLEERFFNDAGGQRFNYRWRFQALASVGLLDKQRLSFTISDELMINSGREIEGNHFDQNRLQAGLQFKLADKVFLHPAYLYIHQYQASRKAYRNVDVFRTGVFYKW